MRSHDEREMPSRIPVALLCALVASAALMTPAASQAFNALDFQPLEVGDSWIYLRDGIESRDIVVGTALVNGAQTLVLEQVTGPEAGAQRLATNDASGLRIHKVVIPAPNAGSITYTPPGLSLEAVFSAPSGFTQTGTVSVHLVAAGTFPGTYTSEVDVIGLEMVTVPAGSFEALRVDSSLDITIDVLGTPARVSTTASDWFASGIGAVKGVNVVEGEMHFAELVSTNVPEPTGAVLPLVALCTVAAAARSRPPARISHSSRQRSSRVWGRGRSWS